MGTEADAAILNIYETWHVSVVARDAQALMDLYADDAVFESPLVWALSKKTGIVTGKAKIGDFFATSFRTPENGLGRWYRTGKFLANGRQLVWEYPRATPDGDQVDLMEVMDVTDGRIATHRVYWGWIGIRTLSSANLRQGIENI